MSAPRYGLPTGTRSYVSGRGEPESNASAFSTSFDSRSEERLSREGTDRDVSRDATRDTGYSQHDPTFTSRKNAPYQPRGDTSSDTERHGSYDFRWAEYQKPECSCAETGGWQKLSFLLLVIGFLGHSIAVCTPYWAVGFEGDQWSLYEGVWMSCYRDRALGRWVCSTYDTIRNLFEQPPWYEASQVSAVLSVILLLPALVAATLYSCMAALSGKYRASWILIFFLGSATLCGFLSFVIFGAGYDLDQEFPPGDTRLHVSFGLQIISFLFCAASLATHLKDSLPNITKWNNKESSTGRRGLSGMGGGRPIPMTKFSNTPAAQDKSRGPKVGSFSLPKFPSALSRFRPAPSAPSRDELDRRIEREPTAAKTYPAPAPASSAPSQRAGGNGNPSTYRSYAPSSGGSVSGHDSQV